MSEEILINGKKITELSDMFFEYCELKNRCEDYLKQLNALKPENKLLHKEIKKYKQALEEIRKKITPVCADCNNIDGFTTWDDCENVCEKGVIKYLKIIDEVLK